MTATKEQYGKRGGIVGYHGYQSFKPGELTPEECHKIGVLTAKRMWGDQFEVIVATHVKGSSALHNHFVINSVSFKDGKKYRWQKGSYRQLRRVSDELCRQHQLSIIESPMPQKVPRQIWIAEKQGKVTHASIHKVWILNNPNASPSKRMFGLFSYGQYDRSFIGSISVRTERGAFSPSLCSYRGDRILNLALRGCVVAVRYRAYSAKPVVFVPKTIGPSSAAFL